MISVNLCVFLCATLCDFFCYTELHTCPAHAGEGSQSYTEGFLKA